MDLQHRRTTRSSYRGASAREKQEDASATRSLGRKEDGRVDEEVEERRMNVSMRKEWRHYHKIGLQRILREASDGQ